MSRSIKITHDTLPFICANCGRTVPVPQYGTKNRNHCPYCLWSLHVDMTTGDRRCGCRGPMEPVGVWVHHDGEWSVIHRCTACGIMRANRIAADDSEARLLTLAARPMMRLPFPAEPVLSKIASSDSEGGMQ